VGRTTSPKEKCKNSETFYYSFVLVVFIWEELRNDELSRLGPPLRHRGPMSPRWSLRKLVVAYS